MSKLENLGRYIQLCQLIKSYSRAYKVRDVVTFYFRVDFRVERVGERQDAFVLIGMYVSFLYREICLAGWGLCILGIAENYVI